MTEQIEQFNIPNATISVVSNGEVIFQKGYGYANIGIKTSYRCALIEVKLYELAVEGRRENRYSDKGFLSALNHTSLYPLK